MATTHDSEWGRLALVAAQALATYIDTGKDRTKLAEFKNFEKFDEFETSKFWYFEGYDPFEIAYDPTNDKGPWRTVVEVDKHWKTTGRWFYLWHTDDHSNKFGDSSGPYRLR